MKTKEQIEERIDFLKSEFSEATDNDYWEYISTCLDELEWVLEDE